MTVEEVRLVVEQSGFATGLFVGSLALAAGVLVILVWPRSSPPRLVPVAGLLLVGSAAVALHDQARLPAELVPGLAALALAGAAASVVERVRLAPAVVAAVLAVPGAWLVAGATGLDETPRLLLVAAIALGGALVAAADHDYRRLGLGPVLVLATMAGAYATVPDTEHAVIVLGATVPLAVLGWPWPLARLGRAGSLATVGLLAWVAVTDGSLRAGSTVGAIACLGVFLVEPVVGALRRGAGGRDATGAVTGDGPGAWPAALPVIGVHLLLVAFAARVAGFRSSALEAAGIAGLAMALAVLAGIRWPELLRRAV